MVIYVVFNKARFVHSASAGQRQNYRGIIKQPLLLFINKFIFYAAYAPFPLMELN